eukprot:6216202-Karenia_brevis.AAC.1
MTNKEQPLLDELPHLPDLQSAWLILKLCCAARANHLIRGLPPSLSASYAVAHDRAMWQTCKQLFDCPDEDAATEETARALA